MPHYDVLYYLPVAISSRSPSWRIPLRACLPRNFGIFEVALFEAASCEAVFFVAASLQAAFVQASFSEVESSRLPSSRPRGFQHMDNPWLPVPEVCDPCLRQSSGGMAMAMLHSHEHGLGGLPDGSSYGSDHGYDGQC